MAIKRIRVTVAVSQAQLPSGVAFDHKEIKVRDALNAEAAQVFAANDDFVAEFDVEDGAGLVTVTDFSDMGNPITQPLTQPYDTRSAPPPPPPDPVTTYPASTGISVSVLA